MTKKNGEIREALECATAALVRAEYIERLLRLRIEQARSRCGLADLIDPALVELHNVLTSVQAAKGHVAAALGKVVE